MLYLTKNQKNVHENNEEITFSHPINFQKNIFLSWKTVFFVTAASNTNRYNLLDDNLPKSV